MDQDTSELVKQQVSLFRGREYVISLINQAWTRSNFVQLYYIFSYATTVSLGFLSLRDVVSPKIVPIRGGYRLKPAGLAVQVQIEFICLFLKLLCLVTGRTTLI